MCIAVFWVILCAFFEGLTVILRVLELRMDNFFLSPNYAL
jgi:hypothetical protein